MLLYRHVFGKGQFGSQDTGPIPNRTTWTFTSDGRTRAPITMRAMSQGQAMLGAGRHSKTTHYKCALLGHPLWQKQRGTIYDQVFIGQS